MWEAIRNTAGVVVALAALWPAAASAADPPPESGCDHGADHNLCSDGSNCYEPNRALIRLTPEAYANVRQDPSVADTGVPELDDVNASVGATSFAQLTKPAPTDDAGDPAFHWYVIEFPGAVPDAVEAYLGVTAVEAAEPAEVVFADGASVADACLPSSEPGSFFMPASHPRAPAAEPPPKSSAPKLSRKALRRARHAMRRRHGRFFVIGHGNRFKRTYALRFR